MIIGNRSDTLYMGTNYYSEPTANTRRPPNVGSMLGQRRRRWTNIEPTLGERLVFAGGHVPKFMQNAVSMLSTKHKVLV